MWCWWSITMRRFGSDGSTEKTKRVLITDRAIGLDQALTLLNKGEIDCLLLDIHMPAMDGLQMIQKVREPQGGTWFTLFMASTADVKSRGRALRAGRCDAHQTDRTGNTAESTTGHRALGQSPGRA